ncbi:hypothetical protein [Sphingomonas sp. RB1R13]|uniref:hypothetical protein n=1 Tax=Sphingomonas sp. RB1R13 TaxID=3096159 RepID=UPI002FC63C38
MATLMIAPIHNGRLSGAQTMNIRLALSGQDIGERSTCAVRASLWFAMESRFNALAAAEQSDNERATTEDRVAPHLSTGRHYEAHKRVPGTSRRAARWPTINGRNS